MRRLTRPPLDPALVGPGTPAAKELADATAHFTDADWPKTEAGFTFSAYKNDAIKALLNAASKSLCAYCESRYGATQPMAIEHYRPSGGTWRVDGDKRPLDKPGYYWLACTWENLLPACTRCNTAEGQYAWGEDEKRTTGKGNWFPLADETKRAKQPDDEAHETPLLLNPYEDDPELHLEFVEEAVVRARKDDQGRASERGSVTIEVLGLNRRDLVEVRRERLVLIEGHLKRMSDCAENVDAYPNDPRFARQRDEAIAQILPLTDHGQVYSGMAIQVLKQSSDWQNRPR